YDRGDTIFYTLYGMGYASNFWRNPSNLDDDYASDPLSGYPQFRHVANGDKFYWEYSNYAPELALDRY
ncbi:hypothetical protein SAMN04487770_1581, partial [Butyrivibrio sp. ob235]|uniref:hypothetical protein n=1 Tax=Butyrivibrio sp. ob235 TaxID=1761780 RepID=UPI0008CE9201